VGTARYCVRFFVAHVHGSGWIFVTGRVEVADGGMEVLSGVKGVCAVVGDNNRRKLTRITGNSTILNVIAY
jgi:hypothetical protein